jgi:hypothetical protein
MTEGTPKDLREAIRRALYVGPLSGAENRLMDYVKDFLAQRFGAAQMQAQGNETPESLDRLWKSIFREEPKEKSHENDNG